MFEQQSSEDAGPVLGSDLIRDDHRLHHQMGDTRQRVLLQVQQNGTCGTAAEEGKDGCNVWRRTVSQQFAFVTFHRLPFEMCAFLYLSFISVHRYSS